MHLLQFHHNGLIRCYLQLLCLIEFGLCFVTSTHGPIEPSQLPMNFGVIGAELFSLLQFAHRLIPASLPRVCEPQIKMCQLDGRLNLNSALKVKHRLVQVIFVDLNVCKIGQRKRMNRVIDELSLEFSLRLIKSQQSPQQVAVSEVNIGSFGVSLHRCRELLNRMGFIVHFVVRLACKHVRFGGLCIQRQDLTVDVENALVLLRPQAAMGKEEPKLEVLRVCRRCRL